MGNSIRVYDLWRKAAGPQHPVERAATYQLYVGADNVTGLVSLKALRKVLDARHAGYTITFGEGSWEGKREHSVVVTVVDTLAHVTSTARVLAKSLNQESVGLVRIGGEMDFVS
jgi:hypothetical protein